MGQIINRRRVFGGGGIDYSKQYLTFVSMADNNEITFSVTSATNISPINIIVFKGVNPDPYSGWSSKTATEAGTVLSTLNRGEKLYVRISNYVTLPTSYSNGTDYHYFSSTGEFALEGNIMSLIYHLHPDEQISLPSGTHTFYSMFSGCSTLADITNLVLPATTLAENCYDRLFYNCTGLTEIPSGLLPATTLTAYCYSSMFDGCSSLTSIPSDLLPATTMASRCYGYMFQKCTSLTTIPSGLLPATTLATYCYQYMFGNCSSLTSVPSNLLPATTMANYCYEYMFRGTGITALPEGFLPATTLAVGCYQYMFLSSSVATVPNTLLPATTLANSCYRAMFSTCASLAAAPDLPAGKLVAYCYRSMFYQCSSIKYMKCLATSGLNTTECTQAWLTGNPGGGTFYAKSGVSWASGNNGIPSNWTRVNV